MCLNSSTKYVRWSAVRFFQPAKQMPSRDGHAVSKWPSTHSTFVTFQSAVNRLGGVKQSIDYSRPLKMVANYGYLPKFTSLQCRKWVAVIFLSANSVFSFVHDDRSIVCHSFGWRATFRHKWHTRVRFTSSGSAPC